MLQRAERERGGEGGGGGGEEGEEKEIVFGNFGSLKVCFWENRWELSKGNSLEESSWITKDCWRES